jgi:hypothetical protein
MVPYLYNIEAVKIFNLAANGVEDFEHLFESLLKNYRILLIVANFKNKKILTTVVLLQPVIRNSII